MYCGFTAGACHAPRVPYEEAHQRALTRHPLYGNYDREVVRRYPEYFNKNWQSYWDDK